jgi:hypothetical protein
VQHLDHGLLSACLARRLSSGKDHDSWRAKPLAERESIHPTARPVERRMAHTPPPTRSRVTM